LNNTDGFPDFPTQEQFEEWLRQWQPILGLSDWEIRVRIVPAKKLSDPKHTAECWSNSQCRAAELLISRDEEASEYLLPEAMNWEETLVHESVHCLMDPSESEGRKTHHQEILYEQGINALAKALVRARRGEVDK
jgi:hypothetical protein